MYEQGHEAISKRQLQIIAENMALVMAGPDEGPTDGSLTPAAATARAVDDRADAGLVVATPSELQGGDEEAGDGEEVGDPLLLEMKRKAKLRLERARVMEQGSSSSAALPHGAGTDRSPESRPRVTGQGSSSPAALPHRSLGPGAPGPEAVGLPAPPTVTRSVSSDSEATPRMETLMTGRDGRAAPTRTNEHQSEGWTGPGRGEQPVSPRQDASQDKRRPGPQGQTRSTHDEGVAVVQMPPRPLSADTADFSEEGGVMPATARDRAGTLSPRDLGAQAIVPPAPVPQGVPQGADGAAADMMDADARMPSTSDADSSAAACSPPTLTLPSGNDGLDQTRNGGRYSQDGIEGLGDPMAVAAVDNGRAQDSWLQHNAAVEAHTPKPESLNHKSMPHNPVVDAHTPPPASLNHDARPGKHACMHINIHTCTYAYIHTHTHRWRP